MEPDAIDRALEEESKARDAAPNDQSVDQEVNPAEDKAGAAEKSRSGESGREGSEGSEGSDSSDSDSDSSDSSDSDSDSDSSDSSDSDSESGDASDGEGEAAASDNETEIPRTRNEVLEEQIPSLPADLQLTASTPLEPVGTIKAVGNRAIVIEAQASARYRVLADGAVLVVKGTEAPVPLGVLYETFGPVDRPFYVVKFSTDAELEPFKDRIGEEALQVVATAQYVRTDELKVKGTDASNFNDEEVPLEEQEFSDDEQEMLAKMKTKKRKKSKRPSRPPTATAPSMPGAHGSGMPMQPMQPMQSMSMPMPMPSMPSMPMPSMPMQSMPPMAPGMPGSGAPGTAPAMSPEQQWYQFQLMQYQMFRGQQQPPPPPY